MDIQSKEYKSHIKIYLIIWFITIIAISYMYFIDYKKWILPLGFTYWIWIIVMGNYERFRFSNYLKKYHPILYDKFLNGFFQELKIIYSNDNLEEHNLEKIKKYYRIIIIFIRIQILTIPIIAILLKLVR